MPFSIKSDQIDKIIQNQKKWPKMTFLAVGLMTFVIIPRRNRSEYLSLDTHQKALKQLYKECVNPEVGLSPV